MTSLSTASVSQQVKSHNSVVGHSQNEDSSMQFKTVTKNLVKKLFVVNKLTVLLFAVLRKRLYFVLTGLSLIHLLMLYQNF